MADSFRYADYTLGDPNALKRWVHRRRLAVAIDLAGELAPGATVLDFGAGDGETCKWLARRHPRAQLVCYEPAPALRRQAADNLHELPGVRLLGEIDAVADGSIDCLLCLEVLEHLPPPETDAALAQIGRVLRPGGRAVIGVPVEVGPPALYKGLFRMARHYGTYDARALNVLACLFGRPPADRPIEEIGPGLRFHFFHTGFDHRRLAAPLASRFTIERRCACPLAPLGTALNPEVYFVVRKT